VDIKGSVKVHLKKVGAIYLCYVLFVAKKEGWLAMMKRIAEGYLENWVAKKRRKPCKGSTVDPY
jgi:hypothetical protein